MKVLVSVKTAHGGMWILPQIAELRQRGHAVVVLIPPGPGRLARALEEISQADRNVTVVRSPFDFRFRLRPATVRGLGKLRRVVRGIAPDAILYHLYATALAIRLATLGLRLRKVHMVAGPLYLESPIVRIVERLLCRIDDHIVCGSSYTYEKYRSLGCDSTRLSVIPYGVDTERFAPDKVATRASAREQLRFSHSDFVVVMVAYVYAPKRLVFDGRGVKGHEDLLEAWRDFSTTHSDARLLLVGGGFDELGEEHRRKLIESLDATLAQEQIVWMETVADVRLAYAASNVSISPSLSENHGAALEASAMATPCIVSDAGALPEAVTADTGWVHVAGSSAGIIDALSAAYSEWQAGALDSRGARAREYMREHFDQGASSASVIDRVVATGPAR